MQIKNLTKSFGNQVLFENVNMYIPENEKIGLTGVNGAGKTTFFKIMMGIEPKDTGSITFKKGTRLSYLAQVITDDIDNQDINVLEYLLSGRPIDKLNKKLQDLYNEVAEPSANQNKVFDKIDRIQSELEYWEAYKAESILLKLIEGMGIDDDILSKSLKELSGGQKSKVAFARLLYSKPEVLLLDEPTNHLDEKSKKYVTDYLRNYKGTVFVISHDIEFLNKITTKTLFLDKRTKKLELFDGNYDKFKRLQKEREENLLKQAEKQRQEEERLRSIINLYSNSSGKRKRMAQDREKKLEKLMNQKIEIVGADKKVHFKMQINREDSKEPLKITNLCFKYNKDDTKNIIDHLNFNLFRGEKFLVVGENGVGKSTLLKLIVGLLTPDDGTIELGNKTDLDYYAQELELLEADKTIFENLMKYNFSERELRSVLSRFLFTGEDIYKKVGVLSPGEKARVALSRIAIGGANLLLLDEPTNHLDPETQKIIADVFREYPGTMIVVSHNPEFVDNLGIERLLILPEGRITYYDKKIVEQYHVLNKEN